MKLWQWVDAGDGLPRKWLGFYKLAHGKAIILRLPSWTWGYNYCSDIECWCQRALMWSTWSGLEMRYFAS